MSVYIIVAEGLGYAKIGYSQAPRPRIEQLQIGCPFKLHLAALIPGDPACEASLHAEFEDVRVRGEWFAIDHRIEALLQAFSCRLSTIVRNPRRKKSDLPSGVSRHRHKWKAHIKLRGKKYLLGTFPNPEEAGRAYSKAVDRLNRGATDPRFDVVFPIAGTK